MALCMRFDMITKMLRCRHGCILERVLVCLSVTCGLLFLRGRGLVFCFPVLFIGIKVFKS
jgi:hypothetical protein